MAKSEARRRRKPGDGNPGKAVGTAASGGDGQHRDRSALVVAMVMGCAALAIYATTVGVPAPTTVAPSAPAVPTPGESEAPPRTNPKKDKPAKLSASAVARTLDAATAITSAGPAADRALKTLLDLLPRATRSLVAEVHIEIANKYDLLAKAQLVEDHLRKAVRLSKPIAGPQHGHATYALASYMLRAGSAAKRPEIIELLRAAIKRVPDHADALHWLGHQLMRSTMGYAEAETALAAVTLDKLSQSHPLDTIMLLGQAKERLGKLAESAATFLRAERLQSSLEKQGRETDGRIRYRFGLSRFQYCRLLVMLGRPADALQAATAALQVFPEMYHLHDITALAYAQLGKLPDTGQVYSMYIQALSSWPDEHRIMPFRVLGATLAHIRVQYAKGAAGGASASTNWIDQGAQALPAYAASPPLEGGTTAGGEPEPGAAAPAKDGVGLNGGWPTREIGGPDAGRRCNIERRTGLSKPEFLREYADKNRPVILKGLLDDWPATTTWRRDEFVAKYGAYNVTLRKSSDVAYDNEFGGLGGQNMSIKDYVEAVIEGAGYDASDPPYVLSTSLRAIEGLRDDYVPPDHFEDRRFGWTATERQQAALMFLGVAGSGVSLHEHTNAWNALVYGKKHWILLPPYVQYGPTGLPHAVWMDEWYPKFKHQASECTQYPGEVLYVPTNWMHSLVNLQASIGIAVEAGHDPDLLSTGLTELAKTLGIG